MDGLTLGSRPYRWPWHGKFNPGRTALLVFFDGEVALPARATLALLKSLAALAERVGITIVELPSHSAAGPPLDFGTDVCLVRPHHGGFSGTDLDVLLRRRGITDLIFAGFPFELGADCTMRQANDLGYECLALTDCCTGLAADTLAGAISSIQMSGGIFGAVAETATVLDLLARACEAFQTNTSGSQ